MTETTHLQEVEALLRDAEAGVGQLSELIVLQRAAGEPAARLEVLLDVLLDIRQRALTLAARIREEPSLRRKVS